MASKKITKDVLESFLSCPLKASLKLNAQRGDQSDYERMLIGERVDVGHQAIDGILRQHPMERVECGISLKPTALKRGPAFVVEAVFEDECFHLLFDGLKRVEGSSKLGAFHYIPILFYESRHLRKEQKLLLGVYAVILAQLQGQHPEYGLVWHGRDCRVSKVHLDTSRRDATQLLTSLRQMRANEEQPTLILNDHCPVCEFRERCRTEALRNDSLSLLRGVGQKEIKKLARKGILTVTQLSHTFRPRRKGKRAEPGSHKRHHSLQAMAIRDKTVYVLGSPKLPTNHVRVFFDVEADPEERYIYLIGMVVVADGAERRFSFWADSKQDERTILAQCLTVLSDYRDFTVYSYGSYEQTFLKRMKIHDELAKQIDRVIDVSVNVLSVIYAHIYFPTYTNGLKDIGACLGCTWTDPEASGLQSTTWRAKWEATRDDNWKQKLVQYNIEDCIALQTVTDYVDALSAHADSQGAMPQSAFGPLPIASVQEFDKQARARKWEKINFIHADYEFINGCAYFNYQRQRVYVRSNKALRKSRIRSTRTRNRQLAVTRRAEVVASACESCHGTDLDIVRTTPKGMRGPRVRRAFDVIGTRCGIKLSVIECRSKLYRCRDCGAVFVPSGYLRLARYFHGLKGWAMHQHIAHQLSFGTIREMIETFFNLPVPKPELHRFKAQMAQYYEPSLRYLWDKLLTGPLLHVDETRLRLKGGRMAYVWAFTNLEEVAYLHRPNREGEFLRELLKDFHGVLVSDFYTAYDALDCPQQKCLIHLIRDMNDDLLENPFDEDLQSLTKLFGALLRPIVASIGEHGLRRKCLRHFKRDVAAFFRDVEAHSSRSEAAQSLRTRLLRYQQKLFTFLDYDGVPWNNNNAEYAIKRFALYRAHASGMMQESGLATFLTLLSICQTCKYRNLSFWRFLLSRQRLSDEYVERSSCPTKPPLEVYPEGFNTAWDKLVREKSLSIVKLSALDAAARVLEESRACYALCIARLARMTPRKASQCQFVSVSASRS